MNKKTVIIACILLVISIFYYCNNWYGKENFNEDKNLKGTNSLSMLLETEKGSGEYIESNLNSYPISDYVFNSNLSRCENGGTISWDDNSKKVIFSGITSDKCYIYFDKN